MTGAPLRIGHLYPDLMNLHGDRGNVIAVTQRALWHGLTPEVRHIGVGERADFNALDLVLIGHGGADAQSIVYSDFMRVKGSGLAEAVAGGLVLLAVGGAYRLLGKSYAAATGETKPGLGIFDIHTEAGNRRLVGNIVIESAVTGQIITVTGFENHSDHTFLGPQCQVFGRVLHGHGNNGLDQGEGVIFHHSIGTYLHGALLPRHPALTDWLLGRALDRRYGPGQIKLGQLDDSLELAALTAAVRRATKG